MTRHLDALSEWVRSRPVLRRCAGEQCALIPDIAWTKRFPEIGPIRFRLRQQRWFLWEDFGKNEEFMLGVFDRLVRPGDVVYDVGANIGIVRILTQWFGAAKVIAFEPMRDNVELLRRNVELGSLDDRVRILSLALGDRDGEEDLQIDDVYSGTAALDCVTGGEPSAGRRHFHLPPLTERVKVVRLDAIVADEGFPAPDVVKIDTEGAEALVIDGARETLARHHPRMAVATHGAEPATASIDALNAIGYHCYGLVRRGDTTRYDHLEPADGPLLVNNNFVASVAAGDVRAPIEPKAPCELRHRNRA